jgi:uncharacterized membrane protein
MHPSELPDEPVEHLESEFVGPLPSPDVLAEYEKVVPGLAARLEAFATEDLTHRRDLEAALVEQQGRLARRGQRFAFVIAAGVIAAQVVVIALHRHSTGIEGAFAVLSFIAASSILVALIGLAVSTFRIRSRSDEHDKPPTPPRLAKMALVVAADRAAFRSTIDPGARSTEGRSEARPAP